MTAVAAKFFVITMERERGAGRRTRNATRAIPCYWKARALWSEKINYEETLVGQAGVLSRHPPRGVYHDMVASTMHGTLNKERGDSSEKSEFQNQLGTPTFSGGG